MNYYWPNFLIFLCQSCKSLVENKMFFVARPAFHLAKKTNLFYSVRISFFILFMSFRVHLQSATVRVIVLWLKVTAGFLCQKSTSHFFLPAVFQTLGHQKWLWLWQKVNDASDDLHSWVAQVTISQLSKNCKGRKHVGLSACRAHKQIVWMSRFVCGNVSALHANLSPSSSLLLSNYSIFTVHKITARVS